MYSSAAVARRIKNLAKSKGISISHLSEMAGFGRNTVSHIKTTMPKADKLAVIADHLGCSVDYLLGRTDVPEINR